MAVPMVRAAEALQHAGGEQHEEASREVGDEPADRIDDETREQRRLSADPVGNWPPDELSERETQQIRRDDELPLVVAACAEIASDLRQCRQHDVDRKSRQRHQPREERDELAERERGTFGRGLMLVAVFGHAASG